MDERNKGLFQIGLNCWKIAHAKRLSLLIDGESYFKVVYEAMQKAKSSIFIVGWDIHSEVSLRPKEQANKDTRLKTFLNQLTQRNSKLHIYILTWDFTTLIYSIERDLLQGIKLGWLSHERIHFAFDSEHPLGGCHHQKIVVIDDQIAFCGGLDLTINRWDEFYHNPCNKARVSPGGKPYLPFHDVQVMVEGEAAQNLGEIARVRWYHGTGELLSYDYRQNAEITFDLDHKDFSFISHCSIRNCKLAISRTMPIYKGQKGYQEIENLYISMISAAKKYIYIENQYLTSQVVTRTLCQTLATLKGPEVIIVLPRKSGGWLEASTMGNMQSIALMKLEDADRYKRLKVYFPDDKRLEDGDYIKVHSKLIICDDKIIQIGSANLNHRSMGLDSECNLALEARSEKEEKFIRSILACLIADHSGVEISEVEKTLKNAHLVNTAIEALNLVHPFKSLKKWQIERDYAAIWERVSQLQFGDWERPAKMEIGLDHWGQIHEDLKKYNPLFDGNFIFFLTLCFGIVLALLWTFTPLAARLNNELLLQAIEYSSVKMIDMGLIVIFIYAIASLLFIPLNLLVIITASVFPFFVALTYILIGGLVNGISGYGLGYILQKRSQATSLLGPRTQRIMNRMRRGSLWNLVVARIIPVAPNSLINVIAGFCHFPFLKFILGSAIGLFPGAITLTLLQKSIIKFLEELSVKNAFISFAIISITFLLYFGANRRFSHYYRES